MNFVDILSLVLVGAFWGCTNPVLRKGSCATSGKATATSEGSNGHDDISSRRVFSSLLTVLFKFRNFGVWVPYLLNQCGSLLYYKLLAHADLTVTVPICNALALVFSCVTSYALGERVDQPFRAIAGASMVLIGVAVCISSSTT